MITIYGRANSSNVQLVMWLVGELGLKHRRLDYGHDHGGLDDPKFAEMTPHRLIPVIKEGKTVVWESAAINRYIAARHGAGGPFWPEDPALRAQSDMWAEWGKTTFLPAFTGPIFWRQVRTPAAERDQAALLEAIDRFEGLLEVIAKPLSDSPYMAGEEPGLADLTLGHVFYRWFDMEIDRKKNPVIEDYYQRLADRPAYRKHVMVDYTPLRAEEV